MVVNALKAYGYQPIRRSWRPSRSIGRRTTRAVFDAYTADVRRCRSSHVLTGLPDAYGRGRIIGDYRRVALYGVDRLIARKQEEKAASTTGTRPTTSSAIGRSYPSRSGRSRNCSRWRRAMGSTSPVRQRNAQGSRPVALLRIPGRREGTKRRGDVARTHVDLPRRLLRTRSRLRRPHRAAGAGDHRRLRHQAAHRPLPAHAGIRRAVRRRSRRGSPSRSAGWATTADRS